MEGLGIDFRSLIFQLVNFSILIFILGKLLYRPIVRMLDSRREAIKKSMEDTEKIKRELSEIKGRQEELLSQARHEAQKLLLTESQRAKKEYEETVSKAATTVAEMLESGEKRLLRQKDDFKEGLEREVAQMVRESLHKILSESLTEDEREKLVSEAFKKIS